MPDPYPFAGSEVERGALVRRGSTLLGTKG